LIADEHEEVTILFSDIVHFTDLASRLDTIQVVQLLNEMFSSYDALTDEYGVFKVETIGDTYMVRVMTSSMPTLNTPDGNMW